MGIRGAEQEVHCGSGGDAHSAGKHEWQQAHNDASKPDSSEPAVPRPSFLFSRNSHAPTLCLCGQMGGSERGSPKSPSLMLLLLLFFSIQEIMSFLPLNMVHHLSKARLLCVCIK